MYPQMVLSTKLIRENTEKTVALCRNEGIDVWGVTKGLCAIPEVARAMADGGCVGLADSRTANLRRLRKSGVSVPLMLLRIPMPSEIKEAAELADVILVSMPESVVALDRICASTGVSKSVLVMIDTGDLREGLWPDDIGPMVDALNESRNVRLAGVGSNFGCLSGALPTVTNITLLIETGERIASETGRKLETVSGGATSSLVLLERGEMPSRVNQLRVGEGVLLGTDVTRNREIPYLSREAIKIEAEIIERRRKPSSPIGEIGADAFGNYPEFADRGERLRVIAGLGRQDIRPEGLTPEDSGLEILGASSDHLTMDAEESLTDPGLGDIVTFYPDYGAMLAAATSPYMNVKII
ncbi:MAG: alanine/ornithine racemase family PLP-dependent enzyme [Synergistota bacterium]|nr:alanine/ornithine racemase family PLP-dependent enzyme [Synergistota bacterium]